MKQVNKQRILIISMAFYPDNSPRSFRATELTKEFGRQGHEVDVVTKISDYDYKDFEHKYSCSVKPALYTKHYKPDLFSTKRSLLRKISDRLLYQFFFYPEIEISCAIASYLRDTKEKYDILISIAKPYSVHIGCAIALKRNNDFIKKWIADCGDPFTLCKSDVYKFPFYFSYLEKWMFRKANYITIPFEKAKTAYFDIFKSKLRIIPQGFNFSEIKLYEGPLNNSVPTFCYAGALYKKTRNPQKLLEFFTTLNVEFKFVFYTGSKDLLEPFINSLGRKLEIRKPVTRDILMLELSKMDFLLNIDNVYKEQLPSKIIDYVLTKRPILSIDPDNVDYENILRFLNGDYSGQLVLSNLDDYRIKNVVDKFIELVN